MSDSRSSLPASPDGRTPTARAAHWASRIMTISLEMVIPGMAGYWLDLRLGTKVVFMLVGFTFGMIVAMKHLLHLLKTDAEKNRQSVEKEKLK